MLTQADLDASWEKLQPAYLKASYAMHQYDPEAVMDCRSLLHSISENAKQDERIMNWSDAQVMEVVITSIIATT